MPVGQVDIGLYVNLKYLDLRTHFDCAYRRQGQQDKGNRGMTARSWLEKLQGLRAGCDVSAAGSPAKHAQHAVRAVLKPTVLLPTKASSALYTTVLRRDCYG